MNRFRISKLVCAALAAALACQAQPLFACAMCYGAKTDSPLAAGMNWGIMSLLVVVVFVLGSFGVLLYFPGEKSGGGRAQRSRRRMKCLNQLKRPEHGKTCGIDG